jgi:hypothetical protein
MRWGNDRLRWEGKGNMKVLNLYAGIGGNRKLWTDVEVTAVEMNPERRCMKWEQLMTIKIPKGKILCWWSDDRVEFVSHADLGRRSERSRQQTEKGGLLIDARPKGVEKSH